MGGERLRECRRAVREEFIAAVSKARLGHGVHCDRAAEVGTALGAATPANWRWRRCDADQPFGYLAFARFT
jgi:hypothetical protein